MNDSSVVSGSVWLQGQVLNLTSAWWMQQTRHLAANALLDVPDPNVSIMQRCTVFPVEFVVRGYLTGQPRHVPWALCHLLFHVSLEAGMPCHLRLIPLMTMITHVDYRQAGDSQVGMQAAQTPPCGPTTRQGSASTVATSSLMA